MSAASNGLDPAARPGRQRSSLKAYFELVRVFLLPSAVADSHAGFLLALALEGKEPSGERALAVALTSALAYSLGMAANDLFDRRKDAVSAPSRPIPSGKVSPRAAAVLCLVLGGGAVAGAIASGTFWVTALLITTVLLYDCGGKRWPVAGVLLMGLCRAENFLLGASAAMGASALLRPEVLCGAAVLGLFITLVTSVSRLEDRPFRRRPIRVRALPLFLLPVSFAAAAPTNPLAWLNAVILSLVLLDALRAAGNVSSAPGAVHGAAIFVRKALGAIFLVDAGIVLALWPEREGVLRPVLALYLLWAASWLWKRRWMRAGSTGS